MVNSTSGTTLYWASTGLLALALTSIGLADILRMPAVIEGLGHLGYPPYFATILGAWKLLGSAAIVVPGFPRLKEWAYAGMFFTLSGAAISHVVSGDAPAKVLLPLLLLGLVLMSRALRPTSSADGYLQRRAVAGIR